MDYKEVNKDNEEEFLYFSNSIIVAFCEKCPDSALEFPATIDGTARAHIHATCNFLGLASHSQGSGTKRRIIIYPRTLYKEKQEKEARDRAKEKSKLMTRLKD
jgi:hypothetical protein